MYRGSYEEAGERSATSGSNVGDDDEDFVGTGDTGTRGRGRGGRGGRGGARGGRGS